MSACYRSTHPDVLAAWDDSQRRYQETHVRICAFADKYGGEALVVRGGDYRLAGLQSPDVPAGGDALWRRDRKHGGWVPLRKTKAGKDIAKEFDACSARDLGLVPGLPRYVQDTSQMFSLKGAQLFGDGEAVWAGWMTVDHDDVAKSSYGTLDEAMWSPVKRSEFYAAREAQGIDA